MIESEGSLMKVYIKNEIGQQTVRELPLFQALKLRFYANMLFKNDGVIVKFLF